MFCGFDPRNPARGAVLRHRQSALDGVISLPQADFTMSGNAASNGSNGARLVTDTLMINGVVGFQQNDAGCTAIGMRQYAVKARLIQ